MARLQFQLLRRICSSFSNRSSVAECRDVGVLKNYTFSNGLLARGHASILRTFTTEGPGKEEDGDDAKPHHATKIDGGKKYSVVQIDSDGSWRTVLRNAVELVSSFNPILPQKY